MDEDEEIVMIDSMAKAAARATHDIQRRNSAPYDGVMGKLPEWMPGNFHREFREIRNRLLCKHTHSDLLDYIIEMREKFGCRFLFTPAEFIDYDPSAPHDDIYKPATIDLALGKNFDDLPLDNLVPIRTPFNIMRDVTILARYKKAEELAKKVKQESEHRLLEEGMEPAKAAKKAELQGQCAGLTLLTDPGHAEAATMSKNFTDGRKKGSIGPVRRFIRKTLKGKPKATNEALWDAIKAKPPKGWTPMENARHGRYIEGPASDDEVKWTTFCNYAAKERGLLKSSNSEGVKAV